MEEAPKCLPFASAKKAEGYNGLTVPRLFNENDLAFATIGSVVAARLTCGRI